MLGAFRLIPAMQVIFKSEIQFTESSFSELTLEQYAAFERDNGKSPERIFQIVLMEPNAIDRTPEKITWELNVVTESQKALLFEGVAFVLRATESMNQDNPTFAERLTYLRPRLPPVVIGDA